MAFLVEIPKQVEIPPISVDLYDGATAIRILQDEGAAGDDAQAIIVDRTRALLLAKALVSAVEAMDAGEE